MTQEQKARAYDEAIGKLREFYRDYDTVSNLIDVKEELANIFPEIRESEDETIRKLLISLVNNWDKDEIIPKYTSNTNDIKQILAWLEKQRQTFTKKDVDNAYLEGMAFAKDELEKQCAHKTAEWSEEDERLFNSLVWHLRNSVNNGDCKHSAGQLEDWLKSLKDRVQPQPKSEWSKEEKDYYDAIITKLEVTQDDAALTDNQMEFLKSLKDGVGCEANCTTTKEWKPSNEQIGLLQAIVNEPNNAASESCQVALKEIIKQMKKLTE